MHSKGARVERRRAQREADKPKTVPTKGKSMTVPPHIAELSRILEEEAAALEERGHGGDRPTRH